MDDVDCVFVVDQGDVAFDIEEVLAIRTQTLLDFLKFLVLFGIDQLQ